MCRTADAEMYMHQFMEAARRLVSCAAAAPLLLCRCCLAVTPLPVSIACYNAQGGALQLLHYALVEWQESCITRDA